MGLGTTYDVHLGLIGKRVVNFLLVLIKLFSLAVTAESLRAKKDWKLAISLQRGQFDPKFQVRGVDPHQSFLHEEKLHVEGTLQGKDDVFRHVTRRNDKLRDVFRGEGILWTFCSQETVWPQRITVGIACCKCLTREKWYTEGALCYVVGVFADKKRCVQHMLRYEGVC